MPGRESILAADDIRKAPLEIPEWGGRFCIHELSGQQRGELEQKIGEHAKAGTLRQNYRALVVIASLYDEAGQRVLNYEDLAALNAKSGKILERIAEAADRLNKLSDAEIEALSKN